MVTRLANACHSKQIQLALSLAMQELDMLISAYNQWGLHDGTVDMVSHQMREGMPA